MNYQRNRPAGKWQDYVRVVVSGYRLLAFVIATVQVFIFSTSLNSVLPPVVLVSLVGAYSVFKVLHPFHWQEERIAGTVLISLDIAACIFLVISTGGLYSPFLLYTLTPVLTAAMLMKGITTISIAGLSVIYVIVSHLENPFFPTELSFSELSYFVIYLIAACLTAALPYLVNVNLMQRLKAEDTLMERQRLSREIHDGTVQTLAAVCWQIQLLRRRLAETGIDFDELSKLENLATRARQDARESLEMLRNYNDNDTFVNHLKKCLEDFKRDTGIDVKLETGEEIKMEAPVELELLRICQEALANIRKHSAASKVSISIDRLNNYYTVRIIDDGHGFDSLSYYYEGNGRKGQGLSVMRERAESVGGRLRVISFPGHGAEVQVEIPANHSRVLPWLKQLK